MLLLLGLPFNGVVLPFSCTMKVDLVKAVLQALGLIVDGIFIYENDRILDTVVEGWIQADEAALQIGQPGEFRFENVEQVDMVGQEALALRVSCLRLGQILAHRPAKDKDLRRTQLE